MCISIILIRTAGRESSAVSGTVPNLRMRGHSYTDGLKVTSVITSIFRILRSMLRNYLTLEITEHSLLLTFSSLLFAHTACLYRTALKSLDTGCLTGCPNCKFTLHQTMLHMVVKIKHICVSMYRINHVIRSKMGVRGSAFG